MPTHHGDYSNRDAREHRRNSPRHSRSLDSSVQPTSQNDVSPGMCRQQTVDFDLNSQTAFNPSRVNVDQHSATGRGSESSGRLARNSRTEHHSTTHQVESCSDQAGHHNRQNGSAHVRRQDDSLPPLRHARSQVNQPLSGQGVGRVRQGHPSSRQDADSSAHNLGRPNYQHQSRPRQHQSRSVYSMQYDVYGDRDAEPIGSYGGSHEQVYRVRRKRHSHRRRNIIIGAVCVVLVLVVAIGTSGFMLLQSARGVKADADQAISIASRMMDKIETGDMQGLSDDSSSLASLASSMRAETDSPLWAVASFIPVYGSDVSAARTLIAAFDDLSNDALVPLTADIQGISLDSMMSDGRVNVEMFQTLAQGLSNVSTAIQSANEQIQGIGQTHISQVTDLVVTAKSAMGTLDGAVDAANQFAPLIPQMLGADGQTRNYMIVAMTNSEIRSTGGFPGAQGLLTVSDGNISLGDFQKVVWDREQGGVPITDEEYALFQGPEFSGEAMTVSSGDALYNPDFPHSASRITEFWTRMYGGTVDGVIAVDPVFLQYLLSVTGGVQSPDGTMIDGTNAVKYLMSDVYWLYETDTSYQDAIFASVASAAFDKLVSSLGDVDPAALMSALTRAIDEGRLLVWMQNADEEQAATDLGVSGAILTDPETAQVGVYVNDYSYTKSEYYLDFDTVVGDSEENADGSVTYHMATTLTNTMTSDIEAQLPSYLRANNSLATSKGDLMLRVYVYAPAGGSVNDVNTSGDAELTMKDGSYNGIQVSWGEVHLEAGDTVTVTYTVTTSTEAGDVPLDVRATPTVQDVRG